MEEKDFINMTKIYDFFPRADAAKKGAESFAPDVSWRTEALMISFSCALGGWQKSFAVDVSTSQRRDRKYGPTSRSG